MPFVASGSYGCVFRPHLKCKNKKVYKNSVGKVFEDDTEFLIEKTLLETIQKLDPDHTFTLVTLDSCRTDPITRPSDGINNCELMDMSKRQEYNQLIIEYGGKSLETLFLRKASSPRAFLKVFLSLQPLFEGLVMLSKNKLVHQDIKPDNIMLRKNKLYLIDFGILSHYDNVYVENNTLLAADYPYFPPEYKLFDKKNVKSAHHFKTQYLNNFMYAIFISGRNVNLPLLIEKHLGINFDHELSELYNASQDPSQDSTTTINKIDSYQLGITLFMLFVASDLPQGKYDPIKELIKNMIQPNVHKRYTITEAYQAYMAIISN